MRFWKRIGIYFFYPAAMLALGFGTNMLLQDIFYPRRAWPIQEESVQEEETAEAVDLTSQVITADTRYVVRSFDLTDSARTQEEETLPEQYIGMNREQFLAAMETYEASPSLEDLNKGFLSLYVERFSPEEVVIQKNYESKEKPTEFYLAVENNYIVVYEKDKKTKYMSTGIPLNSLSEELAQEVMEFKYVGSEAELYNFLESYSS